MRTNQDLATSGWQKRLLRSPFADLGLRLSSLVVETRGRENALFRVMESYR